MILLRRLSKLSSLLAAIPTGSNKYDIQILTDERCAAMGVLLFPVALTDVCPF